MKKAKAFTLVEILIVVVLLGVLAGVVLPLVASGAIAARESALAHDVQMLRRFVLMYTAQHLEVGPGYPCGDTTHAHRGGPYGADDHGDQFSGRYRR